MRIGDYKEKGWYLGEKWDGMGVGGEKGELVWGEALFLIFFKSRPEKNLMIPLAADLTLTCPLVAFNFSAHIILVVCIPVTLSSFCLSVDRFYSLEHNENACMI